MSKQLLFAYIPVLHRGYEEFLTKYAGADLYLLSREELMQFEELAYLAKDIRVLSLDRSLQAVESWDIFNTVKSIKVSELEQLLSTLKKTSEQPNQSSVQLVFTNDDVGKFLYEHFCADWENVIFEPLFLRWDKNLMSEQQVVPKGVSVSKTELEQRFMKQAFTQAGLSSDWWRHVGAVAVQGERVLLASYNQHMPVPDQQYKNGDPRISFTSGVGGEFSSSIHAEAGLIATAARRGIALDGAALFATTFPCPVCAKQIAAAGVKKLYYAKGYAVLDGLEILQTAGVEVVLVDFSLEELRDIEQLEQSRSVIKDCYVL